MSNLDDLLNHRVLFITGKGGIGKTFTAANLAHLAALKSKRVCLVESRIDDQIAPLFGHAPIGHKLTELHPNISAINIDARENFRDFVAKHLGFEALFEKIFNTKIIASFTRMLPGVAELTLLGRLYHLAELAKEPFDLVIFDGYSSGHFLNLLTTPDAVIRAGLVGPVLEETRRLKSFLNVRGQSAIAMVTTPEPLVMSECIDFLPRIISAGVSEVKAIFVNRYYDDRKLNIALAPFADDDKNSLQAAARYCMHRYAGASTQVAALSQLIADRGLGEIDLWSVPDFGVIKEPLTSDFAAHVAKQMVAL